MLKVIFIKCKRVSDIFGWFCAKNFLQEKKIFIICLLLWFCCVNLICGPLYWRTLIIWQMILFLLFGSDRSHRIHDDVSLSVCYSVTHLTHSGLLELSIVSPKELEIEKAWKRKGVKEMLNVIVKPRVISHIKPQERMYGAFKMMVLFEK